MSGASGLDRRVRLVALAGYGLATLLAFPHELPWGGSVDLGLVFAWLVPASLVIGIEGQAPRVAARTAFVASLFAHSFFFHWFMIVTLVYGGMPFWLGVFAPLVPALYVSVFTALFAGLFAWIGRGSASPVLVGAVLWVAVDWLRGHFLGGFPWATLGYALHQDPFLVPFTGWTGVYGLCFAAAVVGLALAGRFLRWTPHAGRTLATPLAAGGLAHGAGRGGEPGRGNSRCSHSGQHRPVREMGCGTADEDPRDLSPSHRGGRGSRGTVGRLARDCGTGSAAVRRRPA